MIEMSCEESLTYEEVKTWLISCSAFLGFFLGIISDLRNGFFLFPSTTLGLKSYPKSSVGSGFFFVG